MAKHLRTAVVAISPKLASQWLKDAKQIRPIQDGAVEKYKQQILDGSWKLNGEAIKFNGNGVLLDGNHRLRAIVAAGKTVQSLVVRGVDTDAIGTMDTGRNRDVRDLMVYNGVQHASYALAAAAGWAHRLTTDPRLAKRPSRVNQEVYDFYVEAKGFENSMKFGLLAHGVVRSVAIGMALHYLFRKKDVELADEFFLGLGEGTGLTKDDALYQLRERLIKNATMKAKLPRKDIVAMLIKTWNLLRAGKRMAPRQAITWTAKGPSAEDFPVIK